MRILTLDFETFYDDEYSLRKMTPAEYICDRRFETIGAAARMDDVAMPVPPPANPPQFDAKARWVTGPDLPKLFARVDWSKTALMSHNIGFDGAIMAWRYGVVPALYIDTLGMARATLPEVGRASLEAVLKHIGAPPKGDALRHAKGLRLADLMRGDPAYWNAYQRYAERDCDGCVWLFRHMAHGLSGTAGVGTIHRNEEFKMMDAVARMTIIPKFSIDTAVLRRHLTKTVSDKEKLVRKLQDAAILDTDGTRAKSDLMSNERFADVLRALGVEPPKKISLKTGQESYAFAKTDEEFTALLEDEDPIVQAAVAARLGVKSTIEETRTNRFLNIAAIHWPPESALSVDESLTWLASTDREPEDLTFQAFPPRMPFPLKYSGAHTHRLSGDWSLNLQNLGRNSPLRAALVAPKGMAIVSADASQIEARVVSWLAGCTALVEAFRRKIDVYSAFATTVYGFAVNKKDNVGERFVGKTGVLGLGFGMAAPKFILTCRNQGRNQGLPLELCTISEELGQRTVRSYRTQYREVPAYWRTMDSVIHALATRQTMRVGPLIVDGPNQSIILPNGMRLFYFNMRKQTLPVIGQPGKYRDQWLFDYGRETKYTFGGKMTENVVQACARIITMNAHTRIRKITGHDLAGQVHDQLIYVVPENEARAMESIVVEEMRRPLDWFHDLPLDAEGGVGLNLAECK